MRAKKERQETSDGERIAELEAELRQRDDKIKELRVEVDEAHELIGKMREHAEDYGQLIDAWIDAFEMRPTDDGKLEWGTARTELLGAHLKLIDDFNKLVRGHKRLIRERWPREVGRPVAASTKQQADVLKRRKAKQSLRVIALETGLSIRTVRTITEKATGKGRTSKRTNELRRQEFDRLRAAAYRARKKSREALPAQIAEVQETGAALVKQAKGLGRRA